MSQTSLKDQTVSGGKVSGEDTRDDDVVSCVSLLRLQVLTAQDLVDFSPVYRCLHIYTILVGPGPHCSLHTRPLTDTLFW